MTPQHELDNTHEMLNSDNLELLKDAVAFWIADCIVKYRDPKLIESMPKWVLEQICEICKYYEHHGSYVIVSNLGTADHSSMVRELVNLMKCDTHNLN